MDITARNLLWAVLFPIVCSKLRYNRNQAIFQNAPLDLTYTVKTCFAIAYEFHALALSSARPNKSLSMIGWRPPPVG